MKVFVHPKSSEAFRARIATIFGAVHVATEADMAKLSMVMCARWDVPHRSEAIRGACADCGCPIAHMPHAPAGPPKVCRACAVTRIQEAAP